MSVSSPRVSLVVSTVNRAGELTRLMDSLLGQEFKDFEILVVDQNCDDRVVPILEGYQSRLNIRRFQTLARYGISSGRNDGWRRARGDVILFPDDDCWYPPWFLRKGVELLDTTRAALVSGRFANESGRSINGRFSSRAHFITRRSVWTAQSESATFYRRDLLERLGGFNEELGIGSATPWQAAEGPDLILNALQRGCMCYYDPSLYGFHLEYDLDDPTGKMPRKGRMYGRGMGYVLRRHGYGIASILHWALRPFITAFTSAICGRFHRVTYCVSVSVGRTEGWTGHVWNEGIVRNGRTVASGTSAAVKEGGSRVSFGRRRCEMTGPYRARNPFLIAALYTADAIASLLPRRRENIREDRPLRVLVADWGHLGDVVTILPLLKFLELHPRVQELGVLIGSWSRSVLETSDIAARIHVIDHWHLDRGNKSISRKIAQYLARRRSLVHELSQCRYDMSIDIFASIPTTHGITWSAAIPRRVGFTSGGLGPCLTDRFDWVPNDESMLDHQLELLKPLLGDAYPKHLPASYGFAPAPLEDLLGTVKRPYLVLHMGPSNIRGWVPEKWLGLAAALKDQGYDLVVTGGGGEETEAARILSEKIKVSNLTGQLSWKQFVATIANATAVVTIDSVAGHLAACFGVPTVALTAGRQRISLWRPNNSTAMALTHSVSCAPCHRTKGCAAMACVRQIEIQDVLSSLKRVMNLRASSSAKSYKPTTISTCMTLDLTD
jgi:ADP-heptose:LPS heptosyltransferase/glycosyltransferase involved in cell wall biosynthesis